MQLELKEMALPKAIEFNFDELKAEITKKAELYSSLVYTEDEIKSAKADRADLNKFKSALNSERIRLEKEYMAPFNDFKDKVNELINIIGEPISIIDSQIKEVEEKRKQEKLDEIRAYYAEKKEDGTAPEWLDLKTIYIDKWLNASTSLKSVKGEIDEILQRTNEAIETLKALPEFSFEAIEEYKRTLDINHAISEGRRLADLQKAKEEAQRLEAEKKAQEEKQIKLSEMETPEEPAPLPEIPEDFMNPPVTDEPKTWLQFKAHMTVSQAKELKAFFDSRNIEFSPI